MGKRKEQSEMSGTLIRKVGGEEDDETAYEEEEKKGGGFFGCYLLASLNPRFKAHTYIGFTVNPQRRIRQHNGEIKCGAWRTKSKRPWEMVLCIYGFPTNVSALQFEWAWQHPRKSLAVKKAALALKSCSGIANKIKLVYTMLTLPPWRSLNLGVSFFSTKYTNLSAGCPNLPEHMKVQVCSIKELSCYTKGDCNVNEDEETDTIGKGYTSINEILEVVTVHNSEDQNRDCEEPSCTRSTEENHTQLLFEAIEREDYRPPFCLDYYRNIETVGRRGVFGLDEECAISEQQRTSTVDGKCDIEVIDVFTPSPSYKIYSRKKKRGVSSVCTEIIDLTTSPIFV
ncbi:hypothetical protein LguiB_030999 [Lonicera macranthoides]